MNKSEQLAAIVFTDVVGYTTLMSKDQKKAMTLVEQNLEIQKPIVAQYEGVWHKEMGDGTLFSFQSAVQAVNCALEIQKKVSELDDFKLRIGIHLGDVTFKDNDVFGDGVNVASRIEAIADPGGIYISESVQKAIRGRSEIETASLGEFYLKHVDYPLEVFALQSEGLPSPTQKNVREKYGSFIEKLADRNVFRAAIAYIISALIVFRSVQYFAPDFDVTILIVALVAGLFIATSLAYSFEFSPKGIVATSSKQALVNPYSASRKKPFTGSAIVGGLFVLAIVTFILTSNASSVNADTSKYDLAVMYLENLTDNEKYGDQLIHLIHTNLAEDQSLKIVSRQWIYDAMKEISGESRNPDQSQATEVARRVGAKNMLVGRVIQQGTEVMVQIELVDVQTGEIISSEKVSGEMGSIFALADNVTRKITEPLDVEVDFNVSDITTNNYDAYREYYNGLESFYNWRWDDAENSFNKAVELDSTFALAHFGVAYITSVLNLPHIYSDLDIPRAKIAKALTFIDGLPEIEKLQLELLESMFNNGVEFHEINLPRLYSMDPEARLTMMFIAGAHTESSALNELYDTLIDDYISRNPTYGFELNERSYDLMGEGEVSKSLEFNQRYMNVEPQNFNPIQSAFELHLYAGLKDKAYKYLDTLAMRFPDHEWVPKWNTRGPFVAGDGERAFENFLIFKDSITDRLFHGAGYNSLVIQGKFKSALKLIVDQTEVITQAGFPEFVLYLMALHGNTLITAKELSKAKDVFQDLIMSSKDLMGHTYHPMPILSYYYLAYINILEQDYNAAEEIIDQFITKIRSDPNEFRFDSYILLIQAELNLAQGKLELVESLLHQVHAEDRGNTVAYHSLMYRLYWAQGKNEMAIDLLYPYYKNGKRARSDQSLYAREMLFSEYNTGRIYEDMGDVTKAIEYYQLSLERMKNSDPGIAEKEDAQARIKKLNRL